MTLEEIAKAYPGVPMEALEAAYALAAQDAAQFVLDNKIVEVGEYQLAMVPGEPSEHQWYYFQRLRLLKAA